MSAAVGGGQVVVEIVLGYEGGPLGIGGVVGREEMLVPGCGVVLDFRERALAVELDELFVVFVNPLVVAGPWAVGGGCCCVVTDGDRGRGCVCSFHGL